MLFLGCKQAPVGQTAGIVHVHFPPEYSVILQPQWMFGKHLLTERWNEAPESTVLGEDMPLI